MRPYNGKEKGTRRRRRPLRTERCSNLYSTATVIIRRAMMASRGPAQKEIAAVQDR